MNQIQDAEKYVASQKSLQFYEGARNAFVRVLSRMPEEDFTFVTHNLILMILHEGAIAQVMHFPASSEKFRVLQMSIPTGVPDEVIDWVVAHELGHVMQDRNWQENDGNYLETDATLRASKWGFQKTDEIESWTEKYRSQF
jgi:hypothetical protein